MPPWIFLVKNYLLMVPLSLLTLYFLWILGLFLWCVFFFCCGQLSDNCSCCLFQMFCLQLINQSYLCLLDSCSWRVSIQRPQWIPHSLWSHAVKVTQVSVLSLRWSWGAGLPHTELLTLVFQCHKSALQTGKGQSISSSFAFCIPLLLVLRAVTPFTPSEYLRS